ncbi:hypothetical protein BT93_L5891 [Corymbia citriodora subsp. variegata]|uniref:Thioredoxin domain-containing protein n=1 Tax=Corymbia citriodora subsp. variegata TaxID=360336 RepID=A0A8T0CEX8_CORYI|nr:hypothetical protein BT93_L5891 [Corymbia citriodora subsp. variegata]
MNSGPPLSEHTAGAVANGDSNKNPNNSSHTTVTEITTEADFEHHTSNLPSETLVVIYFKADWAEPCKQMTTVLQTLASTYTADSPPRIAFLSLDAEELSDISERYDVTQVPFIVLQKGGKTIDTVSGGDASKVRNTIEKHAGAADGNPGKLGLPPAQRVSKPEGESKDLSGYAPESGDPATAPQYSSGEVNEATKEDLNQRLADLVKAAPVMLFMKGTPSAPQCGFSRQTVSILRDRGIRYGFFNILADDEVRVGLKDYSEWPTFPQVYVDGELIGGLDIVSSFQTRILSWHATDMSQQLKEEFENDPDFLKDYVAGPKGGPAAAEQQAQPA